MLEKRVGIPLSKLDAYVASSGGLNVAEPAADLGMAIAIAASFRDRLVDPETGADRGEVGLGGQVRPISQLELRLKEASKLGFKRAIVPKSQAVKVNGLEVTEVIAGGGCDRPGPEECLRKPTYEAERRNRSRRSAWSRTNYM